MSLQVKYMFGPIPRPEQRMPGGQTLLRGRVHEFCGAARVHLAVLVMADCAGPVVWICPGWQPERLYPDGVAAYADPGRLILVRARRPEDILWTMEEVLRSGAVPLVVAEVMAPPPLTPVRRMNLAAEAGTEAARIAGRIAPLGLLLTPGEGGAAGAESRWRMQPVVSESTLLEPQMTWRMARVRARGAPPASWHVLRDAEGALRVTPLAEAD
ncbi:MAG: hypothetical protein RIT14_1460 [Pseudomonadota bacterium]